MLKIVAWDLIVSYSAAISQAIKEKIVERAVLL